MKKTTVAFFLVVIILLAANLLVSFYLYSDIRRMVEKRSQRKPQIQGVKEGCPAKLEFAALLLSKSLNSEAVSVFEDYAGSCVKDSAEAQDIYIKIGDIYKDLRNYEKALAYYYKAENISKREELNQKIVEGLEKLGLVKEAQYELKARSSLGEEPSQPQEKIIARIGGEKVSNKEIEETINSLPEYIREQLSFNKETKEEFVRQYVIQEILYKKAKRLGLDSETDIRRLIDSTAKQIIINKLLEKEVIDKMPTVSDKELELYYKAHEDEFVQEENIEVSYAVFDKETAKAQAEEKVKSSPGKEGVIIKKSEEAIQGLGEAKEVIASLFALQEGSVSNSFKIGEKYYFFKVQKKNPEKRAIFEEVKEYLKGKYQMEKEQDLVDSYIKKEWENADVEIYSVGGEEKPALPEKKEGVLEGNQTTIEGNQTTENR